MARGPDHLPPRRRLRHDRQPRLAPDRRRPGRQRARRRDDGARAREPLRLRADRPAPPHPARRRARSRPRCCRRRDAAGRRSVSGRQPHPRHHPPSHSRPPTVTPKETDVCRQRRPQPTPPRAPGRAARARARRALRGPGLAHVAEIVLDRPEAMNAVSTAMARAIAAAAARGGGGRVGALRRADLEPREGVLRRRRPQGAQRLHRRRPHGAAPGGPGGLRRRARPARARHRRRRRLRARGRLRAGAVVRRRRRGRGRPRRAARGQRRRHPRRRRHAAARAPRRVVARGEGHLHRGAAAGRARPCELGAVDEVVPAGTARDRALELARTIAANSPVGLRNAKRAMRLGADVGLDAGLEIEDGCWRATAFSGDRREGVAAFAEKRRPVWPGPLTGPSVVPARSWHRVRESCRVAGRRGAIGPLSIGSRRSVRPRAGRS